MVLVEQRCSLAIFTFPNELCHVMRSMMARTKYKLLERLIKLFHVDNVCWRSHSQILKPHHGQLFENSSLFLSIRQKTWRTQITNVESVLWWLSLAYVSQLWPTRIRNWQAQFELALYLWLAGSKSILRVAIIQGWRKWSSNCFARQKHYISLIFLVFSLGKASF